MSSDRKKFLLKQGQPLGSHWLPIGQPEDQSTLTNLKIFCIIDRLSLTFSFQIFKNQQRNNKY